jgi:hypothetical protein
VGATTWPRLGKYHKNAVLGFAFDTTDGELQKGMVVVEPARAELALFVPAPPLCADWGGS